MWAIAEMKRNSATAGPMGTYTIVLAIGETVGVMGSDRKKLEVIGSEKSLLNASMRMPWAAWIMPMTTLNFRRFLSFVSSDSSIIALALL
jgi:hypothetical protein